ncbi:single-stranded DNA-binding protein [Nonomuraea rubra]|uniref:Single-stranded DNA-binding protein n=1 Tax=Nonomuraea rubra TaxID=46180 RepID=A0A7X0NQ46_9ACTN|nr:single-stranded DNA-binding protein [Nonomuraea rubra]MBB6547492.1 single-stranded DNA-binding protein [Nonomuraea rubra]
MNDIYITLTGNVAAEPRQYSFDEGVKVTSLRVLTTHRYFDRKTGQWVDGEKVCFAVRCWRALGDNVAASVRAGQPVVVSGKLRIREFGAEGDRRFMPEIEASAVGHDLRWGTGAFTKPERGGGGAVSKEMRDRLDEETRDWAMGPRSQRSLSRSGSRDEPNPFHTADAAGETVRPVNANDTLPPTPVPGDGPASTPEPFDEAASTSNPAAAHTPDRAADTARELRSDTDPAHTLWPDADSTRTLRSDADASRTLRSDTDGARSLGSVASTLRPLAPEEGIGRSAEDTARVLGSADGAVRALDPDDDTTRALGSGGETTRALSSEDSPVRKRGPKSGAVRAVGAEDDTAHLLDGDTGGKGRDVGGRKAGREGKRLTMAEKAAA